MLGPVELDHPIHPLGPVIEIAQPGQPNATHEYATRVLFGQHVLRVGLERRIRNGQAGDDEIR